MTIIKEIHQFLNTEISSVNDIIRSHLLGRDELIKSIGEYLINNGGKRIRPIITILTSKMFGITSSVDVLKLSTAVEFIHAATLLHDDVVDSSTMRRFKPTANFIWGNKPSILVGDFLLSQAFKLMVEVSEMKALQSLSSAAAILIEGEVSQLAILATRSMLTANKYDEIITAKTAELFGSATEIGAILANQDEKICDLLKDLGLIIGKIFQITDDLLDYMGKQEVIGKNPGDDFYEGKITLPIILLHEKLNTKERLHLNNMFKVEDRTKEDLIYVQDLLVVNKIQEEIVKILEGLKISAYNLLDEINATNEICKNYLKQLIDFTIYRNF